MDLFKGYKLEDVNGEYILTLYLDTHDAEMADEFELCKKGEKNSACGQVMNYIKEKFPNIKITVCKIMIGSLLIASIPIGAEMVFAATQSANYKVKSGDTLWDISKKFHISVADIKAANDLKSDTIYTNQDLKIPNTTVYTVKSGDTLWKIAETHNTTITNIKKTNSLSSNLLHIGQKLILPATTVVADTISYTVKSGDTLWKIAQSHGSTVKELKEMNSLATDKISIGQKLKVPNKGDIGKRSISEPTVTYTTHTVKSGDTQWSISVDYGIPMTELQKANGLSANSSLSIGQKLKIPVHNIPVKPTAGSQYGEYLDWWKEAQYVMPINSTAKVTDFYTGKTFTIKRTIGANHADCEPSTSSDTAMAKSIWGEFSWKTRPVLVEVNGHKVAASMSFKPHGIQYVKNNNFDGHFDIHFLNSTRHKDGAIDEDHQKNIKIAAGVK